jgi:hypothetical protein
MEDCTRDCKLTKETKGKPYLRLSEDGQTLYLTGEIPLGSTEIAQMLDDGADVPEPMRSINHERSQKIKFLVMNSGGGNAATGQKLMDWVEKKGLGLKVIVPDGAICGSACAEIFRCADNRVANKSAILMYHPSYLDGDNSPRAIEYNKKANEKRQSSSCAKKGDETEAGRKVTAALREGKETCYQASELGGSGGFLQIEGNGSYSSQAPPPSSSTRTTGP